MRRIDGAQRILFVRTDLIGDTLMNVPAIHLLRQTYPKAWITLLCDQKVSPLFMGHPDLDEIMQVDRAALKNNLSCRLDIFKKIKKAAFDIAIVSNPDKFFHAAVFFAGIRNRVGYNRKCGFFLNRKITDNKSKNIQHEADANLSLVRLVSDFEWDGKMPMIFNERAAEKAKSFLGGHEPCDRIIVFHVGTTNPKKRWPPERFSVLADKVQAKSGEKVILIGGPEEKDTSRAVLRGARMPVIDAVGQFSLGELVEFLRSESVRALVSSDSGPMHIAWMLGKPVVGFFAKDVPGSNPLRWGPRDGKSEVIERPMAEISVDETFGALERVLSK